MAKRVRHPHRLSDRSFGFLFAAVFVAIGGLIWLWGGAIALWPFVVAAAFLGCAAAIPGVLMPLNRLWEAVATRLTHATNFVLVTIAFIVTVVPSGLIMRLFGHDPLSRRFDRAAPSYWTAVKRGTTADTLKDQF